MSAFSGVIQRIVTSKVQAGESFTAHDITLAVRAEGHRVDHKDVRSEVHDYYANNGMPEYIRTTISVPTGKPFLYHKDTADPSTYTGIRDQRVTVLSSLVMPSNAVSTFDCPDGTTTVPLTTTATPSATPITPDIPTNKAGQQKARVTDGRGTLSVPTHICKALGFIARQKVYALKITDGVQVSAIDPNVLPADPDAVPLNETYTVDDHLQVRITQSFLSRAGIKGDKYDIDKTGTAAIIKLHSGT